MEVQLTPTQAAAVAGVIAFGVGYFTAKWVSPSSAQPSAKPAEEKKDEKKDDKKDQKKADEKKSDDQKKAEEKKKKADESEDDEDGSDESSSGDLVEDEERDDVNSEPCKLVLAVRMDLKMEKGKVAAQCSHATLGAYKQAIKNHPEHVKAWSRNGQAKITVKVNDEKEMMKLYEKAKAAGLTAHIVVDAGRTQIAAGSKTILAIGPAPNRLIDTVTGNLKLY